MPSTYTPIATTTLGSAASDVTFSSISGSYTDIILVMDAIMSSGDQGVGLRFNGDSGANYSFTFLFGDGSSTTSGRSAPATRIDAGYINTTRSTNIAQIQNYSNTTTYKTLISRFNPSTQYAGAYVGTWRNTAAITSIFLYPSTTVGTFAAGSTFTLYGVKSA